MRALTSSPLRFDPRDNVYALHRAQAGEATSGPPCPHPEGQFMVGESPAMNTVFELIRRFAKTDAAVLITGESGTGKELAACAIHERSSRSSKPFVAVNCAALPATLISSELFGHEKGAFTGAFARKIGQIEAANGGTLFLDEIGDLPPDLQGHLLRFLSEGKIVRLGGSQVISVNVRILSATNVSLPKAIAEGRFREDLYYRLNVLNMRMPPLRERGSDIELLAVFFLRRISTEFGREVSGFHPQALAALRSHPWRGNVREMIAAIRRAVVMGNTSLVMPEDLALEAHLPPEVPVRADARPPLFSRPRPGSPAEMQILADTLKESANNITHAARRLGVSRITLYRMMRRHGMMTDRSEGSEPANKR
jgi:DNA-binding NtrC family response regulator